MSAENTSPSTRRLVLARVLGGGPFSITALPERPGHKSLGSAGAAQARNEELGDRGIRVGPKVRVRSGLSGGSRIRTLGPPTTVGLGATGGARRDNAASRSAERRSFASASEKGATRCMGRKCSNETKPDATLLVLKARQSTEPHLPCGDPGSISPRFSSSLRDWPALSRIYTILSQTLK